MTETSRPGRKPQGEKAMTAAERKRAQRARQKAEQKTDAYFAFPDKALAELTDIAGNHNVTRNDLLATIVEGQLKSLRKIEVIATTLKDQPERVKLIRHKAYLLINEGAGLEQLYEKVLEDSIEQIETSIDNSTPEDTDHA